MERHLAKFNESVIVNFLLKGYAIFMLVWGLASYLDWMPFYQIKLYKVNSVTPIINLFPGQKIRLDFDFHQAISRQDVSSAVWYLSRSEKILFQKEGLEPTIILPTTEGGTYQLGLVATLNDRSIKTGKISFYVVQDIPHQIIVANQQSVELAGSSNSPEFLKTVKSNGVEVFTSGQWKKVPVTSTPDNRLLLEFKPNDTISSFNNQILIRAPGSPKNLNNYGSLQWPH